MELPRQDTLVVSRPNCAAESAEPASDENATLEIMQAQ